MKRGSSFPAFHRDIIERQQSREEEKNRIAKAAANLIRDGDQVMLVAGTTTALIAKHLFGKRDVHVVTNSTLLLPYVRVNPAVRVTLVGGEFRPSMEGVVGPLAVAELQRFHVSLAFIGADGLTVEKGVTAHHVEEAEVVQTVASRADQLVLAADSTKYGKTGFAFMLPVARVSRLITDDHLGEEARTRLKESGLAVTIV
jgi:DeoR family galactitol utilization operon repressor